MSMPSYDAVVYVPNDCPHAIETIEEALGQRTFGRHRPQMTKPDERSLSLLFESWELRVFVEIDPDIDGFSEDDSLESQLATQCNRHIHVVSTDSDPEVEHLNDFLLVIEVLLNLLTGSRAFDCYSGEEI